MSVKRVRVAVGNDVMNLLIDLYLNGFTTGASSALATYTKADDATADRCVDHLTQGLRDDPLAIELVRQQIAETFAGIDTGEKTWTLPASRVPPNQDPS
jgi:hypothetical protein